MTVKDLAGIVDDPQETVLLAEDIPRAYSLNGTQNCELLCRCPFGMIPMRYADREVLSMRCKENALEIVTEHCLEAL